MKRSLFYSAIAIASLCLAACQDLGELSAEIPLLDSESAITISDGQTLNLDVLYVNMSDNPVTGTVEWGNKDYSVSFEAGEGNKGTLTVAAPQYILDNTPFDITLKIADESRESESVITVKPVISSRFVTMDAPSNTYLVSPGAIVCFPTNIGNTSSAASYDSFELLWQDEQSLVESILKAENGKATVVFSAGKAGNACFAAKKGEDIVWSWTVWVSAETPATVSWTGASAKTYEFMDRNLGARTASDRTSQDINGLMFQWGRKDGFPAPAGAEELRKIYDINNNEVEMSYEGVTEANMMELAIKNPLTYFGSGSNSGGQWSWISNQAATQSYEVVGDYWGAVSGKKSQYDPCPAGYKVANSDALGIWFNEEGKTVTKVYVEGSTANKDIIGVEIALADGSKLFFPEQGDLAANNGGMEYGKGSTWPYLSVWSANMKPAFETSGNKSDFQGMGLRLSPTFTSVSALSGYSMSYAFPVRCVKE